MIHSSGWIIQFSVDWKSLHIHDLRCTHFPKRDQSTHRIRNKKNDHALEYREYRETRFSWGGYSPYRRCTVLNVVPKPMLYIRVRKSGAVKVTEVWKGGGKARRKPTQCYQPDELYRTVTHSCLKSRQWEATCLPSSSSSSSSVQFVFSYCSLSSFLPPSLGFLAIFSHVHRTDEVWRPTSMLIFYATSGEYRDFDGLVDRRMFDRRTRVKRPVLYRTTIARTRESCRWLFDLAKGNGTSLISRLSSLRSSATSMMR